jgi:putative heme degradation protein
MTSVCEYLQFAAPNPQSPACRWSDRIGASGAAELEQTSQRSIKIFCFHHPSASCHNVFLTRKTELHIYKQIVVCDCNNNKHALTALQAIKTINNKQRVSSSQNVSRLLHLTQYYFQAK